MKVLHINTYQSGGAGICASRICEALRNQHVDANILYMWRCASNDQLTIKPDEISGNDNNVLKTCRNAFRRFAYYTLMVLQKIAVDLNKNKDIYFTSPFSKYTNLAEHPLVKEADIIHLHWVAGLLDYKTFFQSIDKPIVWTLHDENPGLGGFHYKSYENDANAFLKLIDRWYRHVKKNALNDYSKLHIVAISEYMKTFVDNSEILSGHNTYIINNGVDGNDFFIKDKNECRQLLGIDKGKKVFLFSAYELNATRKGLSLLIEVLSRLKDENIELVCLGRYKSKPKADFPMRLEGLINEKNMLATYYSAADYFVMPSFQEAFAQTPLESLACGTPVIAFPCSGIKELVNKENGIICKDFTVNALYDGICTAMKNDYDRQIIRKDVLSRFSYNIIAAKYRGLYELAMGKE